MGASCSMSAAGNILGRSNPHAKVVPLPPPTHQTLPNTWPLTALPQPRWLLVNQAVINAACAIKRRALHASLLRLFTASLLSVVLPCQHKNMDIGALLR